MLLSGKKPHAYHEKRLNLELVPKHQRDDSQLRVNQRAGIQRGHPLRQRRPRAFPVTSCLLPKVRMLIVPATKASVKDERLYSGTW